MSIRECSILQRTITSIACESGRGFNLNIIVIIKNDIKEHIAYYEADYWIDEYKNNPNLT